MNQQKISDQVRGKSIRLTWTDGPSRNTSQDHSFHSDGTVDWHSAGSDHAAKVTGAGGHLAGHVSANVPHRPHYAAMKISRDVCLVSYLADSGYTLTVALNFTDKSMAGVASNGENWTPVRGKFDVLPKNAQARAERLVFAGGNAYVMNAG
ncbi:MAG: hypothetical protein ABI905_12935 [Betaproteobacteria bacterium]